MPTLKIRGRKCDPLGLRGESLGKYEEPSYPAPTPGPNSLENYIFCVFLSYNDKKTSFSIRLRIAFTQSIPTSTLLLHFLIMASSDLHSSGSLKKDEKLALKTGDAVHIERADSAGSGNTLDRDSIERTDTGRVTWLISATVSLGGFLFGKTPFPSTTSHNQMLLRSQIQTP